MRTQLSNKNNINNYKNILEEGIIGKIITPKCEKMNFNYFIFKAEYIKKYNGETIKTGGKIAILTDKSIKYIKYGDKLLIRKFPRDDNYHIVDTKEIYNEIKGISGSIYINKPENFVIIKRQKYNLLRHLYSFKDRVSHFIKSKYPENSSQVIRSLILGEKDILNKEIKTIFLRSGTMHILAISGLHIGIIILIFLTIFRSAGINKRISLLLSMLCILIYTLIIGLKISIIRSSLMAGCGITVFFLNRYKNILNALAIAAFIIIIYNPLSIYDISFQLSFLTVLGIVLYINLVKLKLPVYIKYPLNALIISISAQLMIIPIIIYKFKTIVPFTPLSNLVAVPLTGTIIGSSILSLVSSWMPFWISNPIIQFTNFLVVILLELLKLLSKLPIIKIKYINLYFIITYYIALLIIILSVIKLKYKKIIIPSLGIFLFFFLISGLINNKHNKPDLKMLVSRNSSGNMIYLADRNGNNILINCGTRYDYYSKLYPFLKKHNIEKINILIITSPLKSNLQGAIDLIKDIKINKIYINGDVQKELLYTRFFELINNQNICIADMNSKIRSYGLNIKFLGPSGIFRNEKNDIYNNSLVPEISFKSTDIFVSGDIKRVGIIRMLSRLESNNHKNLRKRILILSPFLRLYDYNNNLIQILDPDMIINTKKYNLKKNILSYKEKPLFLHINNNNLILRNNW